ncbi:ABC transporter ATP-binding protein [Halopseudomonas sabulinigri]|uniref:ABC transporter ATP-binding protein n=1 Tax=Halopseudomonas sabulinigri TaxID=472181 RepID=UPI000B8652E6|nr:ABC transporter ATP-binding protein [Halopseudomonas sabulinigri]
MMSIQVADVSFTYGAHRALEQVGFTLRTGCLNALLGPNGAGKSTLVALLSRLYRLQQGDILLDGQSIRRHPRHALRQLGVVFQQSTLDLDLTVRQNLAYHAALHGLSRRAAAPRIEAELARQHLLERQHEKVRQLNGGHRRRVEIARALLHQPRILLLDEASVGLDTASRAALNQHVRALCAEQQLTVIWTTHLLDEIHDADPVIMLSRGRVVASGEAAELVRQQQAADLTQAFARLSANALEATA